LLTRPVHGFLLDTQQAAKLILGLVTERLDHDALAQTVDVGLQL
jgi:hypothetical protein